MGMIRESFILFKNWTDSIEALPDEYQLEAYKALTKYGLTGEMPEDTSAVVKAILISFSVGMTNNIARYHASVENGKKGGRPKKEQPSNKIEQPSCENENLEKPRKTQENLTQPSHNLNVNDNVNVNGNVNVSELVKKQKINIFEDYINAGACARVPVKSDEERSVYLKHYQEFFDYNRSGKFYDAALEVIDTIIEAREQTTRDKGLIFKSKKYSFTEFLTQVSQIDCDRFRGIISQITFNEEINHRAVYILGCILQPSNNDKVMTQEEFDNFVNAQRG